MISKAKIAAVIAVFAAIGLITATGAFTTVTAERTATVTTAGDSSALLALDPLNDDYARLSDDTLELSLDGAFGPNSADTGQGVNLNASTQVDTVFSITNQGTQEVKVWLTTSGDNPDTVTFYDDTHDASSRTAIDSEGSGHTLGTGDSVDVSMEIDTRGVDLGPGDELIDGITVHANATAS